MLTFLFTDIENSTRLWEEFGDAMAAALARHDALLEECIGRWGGRVVKHLGDGVFAAFVGGEPLACALEVQRRLAEEEWGPLGELRVRVAVHAGEAERRGQDYFGPAVNLAHRLLEVGWGGQVLLSAAAAAAALPAAATLEDLGVHLLKDLSEPQQLYQLNAAGGPGGKFPPLRSLSSRPHNLPPQPTPFVGREEELAEVAALLGDSRYRLVTLVGPGGMGKTRLALQAAAARIEKFAYGVFFVPLAAVSSPEFLAAAVADALDFSFYGRQERETELVNYVREKEMLLVLDNFEHLVAGAGFLGTLLAEAPALQVLATSRERLNLRGERVFDVGGMSLPAPRNGGRPGASDAVDLFAESARRLEPGFALTDEDRAAVIKICRLVGGMPLGIELAASWVKVLSLAVIAAEIEHNVDFLETMLKDVPARHRSLRSVFDYSWGLLGDDERRALRRLSVFRGGFSRGAAKEVAGATLPLLASLVNKSLVRRDYADRYEVLEVLRQYAGEKLAAAPADEEHTRERHGAYYASFLAEREKALIGEGQKDALEALAREMENARAAWTWAVATGDAGALGKSAQSLFHFCDIRGWFREGEEAFRTAAARFAAAAPAPGAREPGEAELVTELLARQGWFCARVYRYEDAEELLTRALGAARQFGIRREEAFALDCLGVVNHRLGDYQAAKQLHQESLAVFQECGDRFGQALAKEHLGNVAYRLGEYEEAERLYRQSLDIFEGLSYRRGIASSLSNLGDVAEVRGAYRKAKELCERSIAIQQEIDFPLGIAGSLGTLGAVARAAGEYREARRLFRESLSIQKEIGNRWGIAVAFEKLGDISQDLGEYAAAEKLYAESLAVREEIGDRRGVASSWQSLGNVAFTFGNYGDAREYFGRALAVRRELGEQRGVAASVTALGSVALTLGGFPEAVQYYRDALAIYKKIGDRGGTAEALKHLGNAYCAEGDYDGATRSFEESLALSRGLGSLRGASSALNNLGDVALARGDLATAKKLYQESMALDREVGYPKGIAISLVNLAEVAYAEGAFDEAERFAGESLTLCGKIGYREGSVFCLAHLGNIAAARGDGEEARKYFRGGLRLAAELGTVPWALEILTGVAALLAQEGKDERAAELVAFVACHPASEDVNKAHAKRLSNEVAGRLGDRLFTAAQKKGKAKDLKEVMKEFVPTTLFLFASTHDTIVAERVAKREGFEAEVIPKPAGRTGRCGVALRAAAGSAEALKEIFAAEGLTDFDVAEG